MHSDSRTDVVMRAGDSRSRRKRRAERREAFPRAELALAFANVERSLVTTCASAIALSPTSACAQASVRSATRRPCENADGQVPAWRHADMRERQRASARLAFRGVHAAPEDHAPHGSSAVIRRRGSHGSTRRRALRFPNSGAIRAETVAPRSPCAAVESAAQRSSRSRRERSGAVDARVALPAARVWFRCRRERRQE
jgi:hypothetical protein